MNAYEVLPRGEMLRRACVRDRSCELSWVTSVSRTLVLTVPVPAHTVHCTMPLEFAASREDAG